MRVDFRKPLMPEACPAEAKVTQTRPAELAANFQHESFS